jgi:hypothetical protein
MPRKKVRVTCKPTQADDLPDSVIDIVLNEDGTISKNAYFGFTGRLNAEFYPFILLPNGTIDFGHEVEDLSERQLKTNMFDKQIRVGEVFTVFQEHPDAGDVYRIAEISEL